MAELGQTSDPTALVPGSLDSIDSAIAQWKKRAATADQASTSLNALPAPVGWSGAGADGFARHRKNAAARWERLSHAFTSAASALDEYRTALRAAQKRAGRAIDLWEEARQETAAALAPGSGMVAPIVTADPGAALRTQAKQVLADARSSVSRTASSAAAAIRAAADEPDLSAKAWDVLSDASLTPREALDALAGVSGDELARLLKARPDLAGLLQQADPHDVAPWWKILDAPQRDALIHAAPAVIGNLEGVAYGDRDTANRIDLANQLAAAEAALTKAQEPLPWWALFGGAGVVDAHSQDVADAQAQVDALKNILGAAKTPKGGEGHYLISLTDDRPPLAAVAVGDLDTADSVTYAVPGMGTTTAGMRGWTEAAAAIQAQQSAVDPGHSHAVVAWIGYETPPIPGQGGLDVLDTKKAEAGAVKLESALGGFTASRGSSPASLNVVAHSYGTTTASIALTAAGTHVDSFVSVGSAGLPSSIDSASDIHADAVYAGQARNVIPGLEDGQGDQWAWTGRDFGNHPVNPVDPSFGAHTFGTDSGTGGTAVTDHGTHTDGGSGYLDPGTESLNNVALATTGQGDHVSAYVPKGLTPLQQGLVDGATSGPYY
ncbi:alpha/beta hydrolase [Leifsonia sp. LS1]|uniref:alpha/beta hydrolase n=1 Tax=Leifsonia sp. LS1 TaxID=2828483 RepID=UPI001CFDA3AD|nr:alpha/beta hydrolase [Leifsonia sp. LS1]GIT79912.1 alpha/beta hydrolase [Leifsonia sp. LS1]